MLTKEEQEAIRARCEEVSAQHADGVGTVNAYQIVRDYIVDVPALLDALDEAEAENERLYEALKLSQSRADDAETNNAVSRNLLVISKGNFEMLEAKYEKLKARADESEVNRQIESVDDLLCIWRNYALEDDENLTEDAMKLKNMLLSTLAAREELAQVEAERDRWKSRAEELELEVACLNAKEKAHYEKRCDRYMWKARAEALERALRMYGDDCETCIFADDESAICCDDNDRWQFDYERFSGKEDGE